ncbi:MULTISPECIES: tyrosine-protein phosphatase [unclassified Novosphingobium]|uniref:tyrosine-protein phosphatase n=1 Tax=unclassified Novosphingobium TaxID=2644732 RepID=UPI0013576C1A|nr:MULTISPECIES: tyrosine-protein phosphatase [unclassified Novosphingobium]
MTDTLEFPRAHLDRILALEGAHNFRHVAGWRTGDGRTVAPGRLYRASSLHTLTDADHDKLAPLGIDLVVDLRSRMERDAFPSRWATRPGTVWTGAEGSANADLTRMMRLDNVGLSDFRAAMRKVYADFTQDLAEALTSLFSALLAQGSEGAVLIHCAAGKDRTGFVTAMLLRALGVVEDDVSADYLLTNATYARAFAAFAGDHRLAELEAGIPGAAQVMLGAHTEYLASADAVLLERWGSFEHYLAAACGLDDRGRARLQALYLTGS